MDIGLFQTTSRRHREGLQKKPKQASERRGASPPGLLCGHTMPPSIIAPPRIKGTASGVAGNYTKLSIVGKGAFGDIFLCRDTKKGGEQLILKQVQTKGLKASEVRATKQETAVLNHVSHPYIIGYHDTFEDKGVVFIVCLLYTSPSPRDRQKSRMPSSA